MQWWTNTHSFKLKLCNYITFNMPKKPLNTSENVHCGANLRPELTIKAKLPFSNFIRIVLLWIR